MANARISSARCRLCFTIINEDDDTFFQITDDKGKGLDHLLIKRIDALFDICVDFPTGFDCALNFPHVICNSCNRQMYDMFIFVERAKIIDTKLRKVDIKSKQKELDEIEASLKENKFLIENCNREEKQVIQLPNAIVGERSSRYDVGNCELNVTKQDSKEINPKQQKYDKTLRHHPIAILPKGTFKFPASSQEESIEIMNPLSANVCSSIIISNQFRKENTSGHYHLDLVKPSVCNDRSGTKCGNVIYPSKQKEVASQHTCETKNKGCIICQFSGCKRSFDTITALRHHMKHFHTACRKKVPYLSRSRNGWNKAVNQLTTRGKLLSIRPNFENSNFITGNDATATNYGSRLISNSNLHPSSISEQYPVIHTASLKVSKLNKRKEVVLNLKRPFICPHSGCLKAYQNKHYLIQHERVHRGEKPYLCKNCDRRFYRITDLKKHILLKVCK